MCTIALDVMCHSTIADIFYERKSEWRCAYILILLFRNKIFFSWKQKDPFNNINILILGFTTYKYNDTNTLFTMFIYVCLLQYLNITYQFREKTFILWRLVDVYIIFYLLYTRSDVYAMAYVRTLRCWYKITKVCT